MRKKRARRTVVHDLREDGETHRVESVSISYLSLSKSRTHRPERHQRQHLDDHRQGSRDSSSRRALERLDPVDFALEDDSRSGDGDSSGDGEGEKEGCEKIGLEEGEGLVGGKEKRGREGGVGEQGRGEGDKDEDETLRRKTG